MIEAGRMRLCHPVGNLDRELDSPAHVHRPACRLDAKRLPFQELEHEEQPSLVLAGIEERGDVGM